MTANRVLRVGVVGGIFGMPAEYRSRVRLTPETVLVDGLRLLGHDAVPLSHFDRFDPDGFDVVHVHHLSWGAVRASSIGVRTPFVFTLHASSIQHQRMARFVFARADGIVALWPGELERLQADFPAVTGARCKIIPNGIDPDVFAFAPPRRPAVGEPWRLHFAGQLIAVKRVDLLLRALAELAESEDLELALSYHSSDLESQLRDLCAELQIEDRVHFLGVASQTELSERYRRANIAVLTSEHEALPSVITEAMMSGCLPVATDVGAVREQLGPFGVVVDAPTPKAVAGGIKRAIAQFDDHIAHADQMRRSAIERFSVARMIESHVALYDELLEGRARPRRRAVSRRVGGALIRIPLRLRQPSEHPSARTEPSERAA